jgi:hypothetical protein
MLVIGLVPGCFSLPATPRAPVVLSTSADAAEPLPPTSTLAVRLSAIVDADSADAVALVRGEADGALVSALAKPPLAERYLTQVVALRAQTQGDLLLMTPRRALEPHVRYTLVIGAGLRAGGLALGRPSLRPFTTSGYDEAAPFLQLVAPTDGAAGVVRNLAAVTVRWSKPMPPAPLQIIDDSGTVWPSTTTGSALPDGTVVDLQIALGAVLDAGSHFEVRAPPSLLDEHEQPPFGDPPGFSTGTELRTTPPALDGLALEVADRCLVARFSTGRPTVAELCVGDRCVDDPAAGAHAIGVTLAELQDTWSLRAWDESTAPQARAEGRVDLPPLPLVLTEILFQPKGPRLSQQYVELYNVGDDPVELGGLALTTASGFDRLPSATLPSGGYAVVVPDGFTDDGMDVVPPASALLLRVGNTRLGGRGIREGGEPVWLVDGAGRLITRWGGWPVEVAPGQSLTRDPFQCDLPANFHPSAQTPGTP